MTVLFLSYTFEDRWRRHQFETRHLLGMLGDHFVVAYEPDERRPFLEPRPDISPALETADVLVYFAPLRAGRHSLLCGEVEHALGIREGAQQAPPKAVIVVDPWMGRRDPDDETQAAIPEWLGCAAGSVLPLDWGVIARALEPAALERARLSPGMQLAQKE